MIKRYREIISSIESLKTNSFNRIYYISGSSNSRTYAELYEDIQKARSWLDKISQDRSQPIVIVGQCSYDQLVMDLACLRNGIKTIFLPEDLPSSEIEQIFRENNCRLAMSTSGTSWTPIDSYKSHSPSDSPLVDHYIHDGIYTACLSSGTTATSARKLLNIPYFLFERSDSAHYSLEPNQKLIIWMSFSHFIQRLLAFEALALKLDIVLSSFRRVFFDLKLYAPTNMTSAPYLYDILAKNVRREVSRGPLAIKALFKISEFLPMGSWTMQWRRLFLRDCFEKHSPTLQALKNATNFFWSGGHLNVGTAETLAAVGVEIYGAYGISEIGPISSDKRGTFLPGSVGVPYKEVIIGAKSEILVKLDDDFRCADRFLRTGDFIHTGDYGCVKSGRLFVHGRLDDVIVLKSGIKINPYQIETHLKSVLDHHELCIISLDSHKLTLVLNKNPDVPRLILKTKEYNKQSAKHMKISELLMLENFELDGEYYTRNLKLKRRLLVRNLKQTPSHDTISL